jgi:MoaA/NifB/PqqE/SkfB family radical SAM enzyme
MNDLRGAESLTDGDFHALERDERAPFRWSFAEFSLSPPPGARYLDLEIGRPDSGGSLRADTSADAVALLAGWRHYGIDLGPQPARELRLSVDPPVTAPGDTRALGVMVRSLCWHDDAERHARLVAARRNEALNESEYRAGAAVLASMPPLLRITLEVRCNIANSDPCVYCSWKFHKGLEAGASSSDLAFVETLSPLLARATSVNDCSHGEPTLNRDFAPILAQIATDDRPFAFTSNGQPIDEKIRKALLGRNVLLTVSIDSATSAGYARYRDNGFDRILANLTTLCREKKAHGNLPHVGVSFIVMQSNKDEVRDFIRLMHGIGVDRIKFASLHREDSMELDGSIKPRDGYTFDYRAELLGMDELARIGRDAQATADALGVDLYLEWEEFIANHGGDRSAPLCSEPWKSLYLLNRGVFPCCFGRQPLAAWREKGERPLEEFVGAVLNGPAFQEIRRSLADGELPAYCRAATSCPIVRAAMEE